MTTAPEPAHEEADTQEDDEEPRRMGAVRLMYSMGRKTPEAKMCPSELMYVDIELNGRKTQAMIDTGASHNYITPEEAKRIGVKLRKGRGFMKTVNSSTQPIQGEAEKVDAKFGKWKGKLNLSVVPMDDFSLVLGMEFLTASKAYVVPHLNAVLVADEPSCLVRTSGSTREKEKGKLPLLSAMQLVIEEAKKKRRPRRTRHKRGGQKREGHLEKGVVQSPEASMKQQPRRVKKVWMPKLHQPDSEAQRLLLQRELISEDHGSSDSKRSKKKLQKN